MRGFRDVGSMGIGMGVGSILPIAMAPQHRVNRALIHLQQSFVVPITGGIDPKSESCVQARVLDKQKPKNQVFDASVTDDQALFASFPSSVVSDITVSGLIQMVHDTPKVIFAGVM